MRRVHERDGLRAASARHRVESSAGRRPGGVPRNSGHVCSEGGRACSEGGRACSEGGRVDGRMAAWTAACEARREEQ